MPDLALRILITANDLASGAITQVGRGLAQIGGPGGLGLIIGASALAGLAIGAMGVHAVKMAADYQQAMLKVYALTGISKQEFDMMNQSLLAMAPAVGSTPTELAKALYYVASDGFRGATALKLVELSAIGAKVGMTDTMTVAFALTSAIRAFSFADKDATMVMDIMNNTVKQGKMEWQAYAVQVGRLSTAAKTAGYSFTEANAALSTLTQSGSSAAKATTFLINLFNQMSLKTDAMAKHAKAAGISFDEVKFKSMSLGDQIKYLTEITHGNATAMMKLMGNNSIAVRGYELLRDHAGMYKTILDSLNHSTDAANNLQSSWITTQQGLNVQLDKMKAGLDVMWITIGNQIIPVISSLIGWIAPLIAQFSHWLTASNAVGKVMSWMSGIVNQLKDAFNAVFNPIQQATGVLKPLADAFDRATGFMHNAYAAAQPLIDSFDRAHGIIGSTAKAVNPMLDSFDRATGVFSKTSTNAHGVVQAVNPFVGLFQNIKAIIQAATPIVQGIGTVMQFVSQHWSQVQGIMSTVGGIISAVMHVVGTAIDFVKQHMGQILPIFQAVGSFLVSTFKPVWDQLVIAFNDVKKAIQPIMPELTQFAQFLGAVLVVAIVLAIAIIAGLVKAFAGLLIGAIKVVTGIIQFFSGLIQFFSGLFSLIMDIFSGKWGHIAADLNKMMNGIMMMFLGIWNIIAGIFSAAFGVIQGFASGFVQVIVGFFQWLANALVGHSIIPDMINGILQWFSNFWSNLVTIVTIIVTAVVKYFTDMGTQALNAVQNGLNLIKNAFTNFISVATSFGASLIQGIINGIQSMLGSLGATMGNVVSFIGSFLPHSPAQRGELMHLNEYGPNLVKGLAKGIEGATPMLNASMNMMVRPIGSSLGGMAPTGNARGGGGGVTVVIQAMHINDFGPNMPHTVANTITDLVATHLGSRIRIQSVATSSGNT